MTEQLRFVLSIAVRHLNGKRRQTLLVIAGVTIGSMVMILTLALGEGIVQDIKDKIIETSPYIVVTGEKLHPKETQLYRAPADSSIVYSMISRVKPSEKKTNQAVSRNHGARGIDTNDRRSCSICFYARCPAVSHHVEAGTDQRHHPLA